MSGCQSAAMDDPVSTAGDFSWWHLSGSGRVRRICPNQCAPVLPLHAIPAILPAAKAYGICAPWTWQAALDHRVSR
jgi:hypothetical protein